jgi:hypothetical protein
MLEYNMYICLKARYIYLAIVLNWPRDRRAIYIGAAQGDSFYVKKGKKTRCSRDICYGQGGYHCFPGAQLIFEQRRYT